jgi:alkylhydroperoxidase family enzyme
MSPRMTNPSLAVPDALPPLLELTKVISKVGLPKQTLDLVRLRVSQINGRSIRVPTDPRELAEAGAADARLPLVDNWREAPDFTDAERSALALAEAATRLSDCEDPVPDEVWDEAARHYDEQELGALVIQIGLVNLWNRINVSTRQVPVDWS